MMELNAEIDSQSDFPDKYFICGFCEKVLGALQTWVITPDNCSHSVSDRAPRDSATSGTGSALGS